MLTRLYTLSYFFCSWSVYVLNFLISFLSKILVEGKLAADEPAILPTLPLVPKNEKRKPIYGTPQSKKLDYRDRDWDRERDRDFELMPPPGSGNKKDFTAPVDVDQPIDPNEPTYCVCNQVLPSVHLVCYDMTVPSLGLGFNFQLTCTSICLMFHYSGVIRGYDCLRQ